MWSLVFGLATAVFFVLALSMPGPFNPLLFCTALALAAVFGWAVFLAPMVLFLLLFLGFPTVVDLVYSVSNVGFENLRSPEIAGFGNYVAVLGEPSFWRAAS